MAIKSKISDIYKQFVLYATIPIPANIIPRQKSPKNTKSKIMLNDNILFTSLSYIIIISYFY